jgi:hypothetical protein
MTDDSTKEPPRGSGEWWRQATTEQMWEFIEETDEKWARMGLGPRRSRKSIPDPSLPRGAAPGEHGRGRIRDRQVNVKLTARDHERLARVARSFGVRPATMAQLLVNRGLEAALDDRDDENAGESD